MICIYSEFSPREAVNGRSVTADASDSHPVSYSPVGGKMPKPAVSFAGGDGEGKPKSQSASTAF